MTLDLWNDVYQSKGHNRYASVNKVCIDNLLFINDEVI